MTDANTRSSLYAMEGCHYLNIDLWRLICSIGIVILHLEPLSIFNPVINYEVSYVVTRVCVPFFFLTSGFFIAPIIADTAKFLKYIFKFIRMYLICSLLYAPLIINLYRKDEITLFHGMVRFIKNFLLNGSYQHLWYFVSLIWAAMLLRLLMAKCQDSRVRMCIIVILYILGTIGNAYINPNSLNRLYSKIFITTRNGLFMGLPFMYLGYFVRCNEQKFHLHDKRKIYVILTCVSGILMSLEAGVIYYFFNKNGQDMLLLLLPTALFMFLAIVSYSHNNESGTENTRALGKYYRNLSVLIFELHLLVYTLIKNIEIMLKININNFLNFLIVLVITLVLSKIIILLSNCKYGKYIKVLYS